MLCPAAIAAKVSCQKSKEKVQVLTVSGGDDAIDERGRCFVHTCDKESMTPLLPIQQIRSIWQHALISLPLFRFGIIKMGRHIVSSVSLYDHRFL